jgi:hypothetical protein
LIAQGLYPGAIWEKEKIMTGSSRKTIMLLIIIPFLSCDTDKSPIADQSIIDSQYFSAWPQSFEATGVGTPNLALPFPQQRAGAIRQAKLNAFSDLYSLIESLPVNKNHRIYHLLVSDTLLQNKIHEYISINYHIWDTRYMSDSSVEIDMSLPTDGIVPIICE